MRKKLLLAIALGVVATFAAAFSVGCSNTNSANNTPKHNYGEWVIDREATCIEIGKKYHTCNDCNETEWESIPKTEHKYDITNRTNAGHSYTCSVCSNSTEVEPHNFKNEICVACGADENENYDFTFELSSDKSYYILSGANDNTATEIIIPSTYKGKPVTIIGQTAFENFTELKNVSIPDSINGISAGAFCGCTTLEEISLPNSIEHTFLSWGTINIPNVLSDNNIKGAFENCTSLKQITLSKNLLNLHSKFFRNCISLESITLPDNCTLSGNVFDGCNNLKEINVSAKNQYYKIIDGNLYSKDGTSLVRYISKQTEFEIPQTVMQISAYAFSNCFWLNNIVFNSDTGWRLTLSEYDNQLNYARIVGSFYLDVEDLNDSAKMAECLTETFCYYFWCKGEN